MGHRAVNYQTLRRHLQELIDRGYLKEFILQNGPTSESTKPKKDSEISQEDATDHALVNYKVDTIFDACPIEGTTSKEKHIHQ